MARQNLIKSGLIYAILIAISSTAIAQDNILDEVEQLPNKKLEERGERIRGPITSIAAGGMLFATFDKNTNYSIDETEFQNGQAASFKAADVDNSGTLSLFELEDWRIAALGSVDAAPGNLSFDKDYDQRVTAAEFKSALKYVYNVNDKDADNHLTFEEIIRVFEIPRGRRGGEGGADGPNGSGEGQRRQRPNRR